MPRIAELREIDGQLWVRIPAAALTFGEEKSVSLWTESEKESALKAERERCIYAITHLD